MNAQAVAEAPPSRHGGGRVVRAALAAVVLVVVATIAFGLYSLTRERTARDIPSSLAGMRLTAQETGEAAVADMATMHQSDIHILDGWIGLYEHEAAIYVGEAESASDADLLVRRMTRRIIGGGNAMFAHEGQEILNGIDVHVVDSGNQRHYYYERGKKVIWIAAPVGMDPGGFVDDAISRVP